MGGLYVRVETRDAPPDEPAVRERLTTMVHAGPAVRTHRDGPIAIGWTGPEAAEGLLVAPDVVVARAGGMSDDDAATTRGPGPRRRDAASLLDAWRRWGVDLVHHVDGEFVALVWERAREVLHVLGGAVGARPLLWSRRQGAFAACTDVHPLLDVPWVSRTVEREHLAEYLALRVVHAPRTLLRDVQRLEAGTRLRFGGDVVAAHRWDTPTYAAPGTPLPREQDVVPALHEALERSVRRRLAGDRAVGVYLSGGVGSTVIVAAARAASRSLRTFTVAFADEPFPESPFAGRVATLLGMDHETVVVGSAEVAQSFDDAVHAASLPIGNVALVLQHLLARAASAHVEAVLTGDGTDQLFGGTMLSGPAQQIRAAQRFHALPWPLRRPLRRVLKHVEAARPWLVDPEALPRREGVGGARVFDPRTRRMLLLDELLVRTNVREEVLGPYYDEVDTDVLNRVLHAFWRSTLLGETLPRVEATAAAAGLGLELPLVDREVRRLARLLPGPFKLHGLGTDLPTRWLLRATLQGAVPAALVNRPDRGLPRPLDDWLTGAGRLFLEERVALLKRDPLGLWHTTGLEALKRGLGRQAGASQRMWALLLLDQWFRAVRAG